MVNIRREELGEVLEYINGHSESSVGYWSEQSVTDHAKDWRLRKMSPLASSEIAPNEELESGRGDKPQPPVPVGGLEKRRIEVRKRIEQIQSLDEAKNILLSLCDEGDTYLLHKLAE